MSTPTDETRIPDDLNAEMSAILRHLAEGTRDLEAAKKACQHMDQLREENRRRFGEQNFAVEVIRQIRDGLICFLGLLALANMAGAQEKQGWPQWRGPNGDGISPEKGWLSQFDDKGPKKQWEATVGRGFSSPIIRDGALYLFTTDRDTLQRETIYCLDAETGKERWKHSYEIQSVKRGTNPAGGTPAIVGERVFSYGAGLTLVCIEAKSGKEIWHKDLMKELPGNPSPYGFQLSPLPVDNLIVVPAIAKVDGRKPVGQVLEPRGGAYPESGGMLLAFEQESGKEVWRNTEGASAWSSPVLVTIENKKTIVLHTGRYVVGVDPKTGTTRWKYDLREVGIEAQDMAASPVIQGDVIVVSIHKAFGSIARGTAGAAAIRIQDGKPKLLWKNKEYCHWFQSPIIWETGVYGFDERSTFWCLDLQTGKDKWKSKDLGSTGSNGGGFAFADGKVLAIDARQKLTIAEVSLTGPKILSRATVFNPESGYECETAPVLFDGRLYCRNHTQLICFDLRLGKPK